MRLLPDIRPRTRGRPMNSAKTYPVPETVAPQTVVIYCSSPRFQAAFRDFIETTLGLKPGEYVPFVVAGGAGALTRPDMLPKEFRFLKERLELFREQYASIKRVVIIGHEDCQYYKKLSGKLGSLLPFYTHLPLADMKLLSQVFVRLLAHLGMRLELYYAKFADEKHTQITIEPVI